MKRRNSTIVSAATTRKQASIVFRQAAQMIRMNRTLRKHVKIINSTKHIVHRSDDSTYSAISAEAGGQYGEGLDLVILDELAQARTPALYDALMTSLGSQVEPLMVIISTQAPADDHILSRADRLRAEDPRRRDRGRQLHRPPLRGAARRRAARREGMAARQSDARRLSRHRRIPPDDAAGGQGAVARGDGPQSLPQPAGAGEGAVPDRRTSGRSATGEVDEALLYDGRPVYGGLDLSARTDLSALVLAVEDDDGDVHLFPRIWTPADTLIERGLRDRAPYQAWADRGLLIPVPGQVLDYDFLAADIGEISRHDGARPHRL